MMLAGHQPGLRRRIVPNRRREEDEAAAAAAVAANRRFRAANANIGRNADATNQNNNNNGWNTTTNQQNQNQQDPQNPAQRSRSIWKMSHWYCMASGMLAILAIITSSSTGCLDDIDIDDIMPNADIGGGSIFFDTGSILSKRAEGGLSSASESATSIDVEDSASLSPSSSSLSSDLSTVQSIARAAAVAVSHGKKEKYDKSKESVNDTDPTADSTGAAAAAAAAADDDDTDEKKDSALVAVESTESSATDLSSSPPQSPPSSELFLKAFHFLTKGLNDGVEGEDNITKTVTTAAFLMERKAKPWFFWVSFPSKEVKQSLQAKEQTPMQEEKEEDADKELQEERELVKVEQQKPPAPPRSAATGTAPPTIAPKEENKSSTDTNSSNTTLENVLNMTEDILEQEIPGLNYNITNATFVEIAKSFVDPTILQPSQSTPTDIIDKILTSTPRLLAVANLILALTYLLHTAVAEWFLGVSFYSNQDLSMAAGRERLGGFLVFKLLLISAVVAPDTLDLLILLSWYTLLSFLRSLAHLAAATTNHTTQSGQAPPPGVLRLLILVLLCDFIAAAVCVGLFHGAGWGMVLLLTSDCVLLAVDVVCHMLRHMGQVLEEVHGTTISELEEQQLELHNRQQSRQGQESRAEGSGSSDAQTNGNDDNNNPTDSNAENAVLDDHLDNDDNSIMLNSRQLDQQMETMEVKHSRHMEVLDTTVFTLQLLAHIVTVCHFLHIWTLHGIQFTLIDGVLALHLHSALSSASKKIAERRNLDLIARRLNHTFADASEMDIRKVAAAGDVCCICLGAMSVGGVKKVGCGHLFHTHCLREVVERARSMEAARCPLCRAYVIDGSHPAGHGNNNNNSNAVGNNNNVGGNINNVANPGEAANNIINNMNERVADNVGDNQPRRNNNRGERALFRFTTEGILPTWLPIPAFSFEVVRRPPAGSNETNPANVANVIHFSNNNNTNNQNAAEVGGNNNANNDNAGTNDGPEMVARQQQQQNQQLQQQQQNLPREHQNLLQRFLVLTGALPMSPEEESRYMEQLVDMFPQFNRADLLQELRGRRSVDAVAESILNGSLAGRERGGGSTPVNTNNMNANDNNDNSTENQTGNSVGGNNDVIVNENTNNDEVVANEIS